MMNCLLTQWFLLQDKEEGVNQFEVFGQIGELHIVSLENKL